MSNDRWTDQDLADYQAKHRGLKIEILSVEPKITNVRIDREVKHDYKAETSKTDYKQERKCGDCQRLFTPKKVNGRHKGLFCSRECHFESKRECRACAKCGSLFVCGKSTARRFCSKACSALGGFDNPAWNGGRSSVPIERSCLACHATFTTTETKNGLYCSNACVRSVNTKAGSLNGNWRGGNQQRECNHCHKPVSVIPSRARSASAVYCSRDCFTMGEFGARKTKRWASGSKWGMTGSRSGKRPDLNDQFFRSRWEANYARYLNFLKLNGDILDWQYEAETFEFQAIRKGTRFYTPDFKVWTDGGIEYHEVKGYKHPKGETALRRMTKYYPDVKVTVIDSRAYRSIERSMSRMLVGWEGIRELA